MAWRRSGGAEGDCLRTPPVGLLRASSRRSRVRVGDQRGGVQALMTAAGALDAGIAATGSCR
jgi:hypothetical protein